MVNVYNTVNAHPSSVEQVTHRLFTFDTLIRVNVNVKYVVVVLRDAVIITYTRILVRVLAFHFPFVVQTMYCAILIIRKCRGHCVVDNGSVYFASIN